ncbi:MAG TPA: hypothetical protein DIT37_08785 [Bacillus sp. (in: Bacteria)]|nr:hypothetical protein [Bacillus sp. (in: firmicutes)]
MNLFDVMYWNCSCNIKQLGAKGGKVYVTITGKRLSESGKTVKTFKGKNNDGSKGEVRRNLLFCSMLKQNKKKARDSA